MGGTTLAVISDELRSFSRRVGYVYCALPQYPDAENSAMLRTSLLSLEALHSTRVQDQMVVLSEDMHLLLSLLSHLICSVMYWPASAVLHFRVTVWPF